MLQTGSKLSLVLSATDPVWCFLNSFSQTMDRHQTQKPTDTDSWTKMDSSNLSDNPDFYVHIHNYSILDYGYDEFMLLNSTHKGTNWFTFIRWIIDKCVNLGDLQVKET